MKTWLSLLLLVTLAQCTAAEPAAMIAELRAALKEEMKLARGKESTESKTRQTYLKSLTEQLPEKDLADEQVPQTVQVLGQIRTVAQSKKAQELVQTILAELRTHSKEAANRLQEKINMTVAKCIREGLKAGKSGELDAPLREIAELKKQAQVVQYRSVDSQIALNSRGIQSAEELLNGFQDALFAAEKGNISTDYSQRLTGNYSTRELGDILPRSELLELMHGAQARLPKKETAAVPPSTEEMERQVSEILAGAKKLEQLDGAVKQVDELIAKQRKGGRYLSDMSVVTELKNLRNFYQDIVSGMATTLDSSVTSSKPKDENISRLRNMLIRFAIPRLFGMVADKAMKEDESLAVFIRRAVTEATERRDWKLLAKALDLNQRLVTGQSPLNAGESSALQQFLAAQNQERARQYAAAVASYLATLKTGSQSIPAEFIGDRLAAIEKEHPKEYAAGVELTNNPPSMRYTATSGAPKTVFSPSGAPSSQVSASLPMRVGPPASSVKPTPIPAPDSAPPKAEPTPPTPKPAESKPAEPQPTEKKGDSTKP